MLAGGGITNGSFLEKDLIDELSVVTVPVVEGERSSASLFENVFMSGGVEIKPFPSRKRSGSATMACGSDISVSKTLREQEMIDDEIGSFRRPS